MTQNRPFSHRRRTTALLLVVLTGMLAACAAPTAPAPSTRRAADWACEGPALDGGQQPDTTNRSGYTLPHG